MHQVQLGRSTLNFGSTELNELQDSNDIIDDQEKLQQRMNDQGYLLIRQLHNREEVLEARLATLRHLYKLVPDAFHPDHPIANGVLCGAKAKELTPFLEGKNELTHSVEVLKVLEGERVKKFFRTFFGEEPQTFDFKWLRAIPSGAFTGAHVDNVYMSRGTDKLFTCWTPFGDVTMEMGTLAMCEGSNRLPGFAHFQETYGSLDLDREGLVGTGWFTEDPKEITQRFGGEWKTADFRAGDVLIFTQRTVHMSSVNTTQLFRISCDTRWLASSETADPRYVEFPLGTVAKPKYGVYGRESEASDDAITVEKKKREWGFL